MPESYRTPGSEIVRVEGLIFRYAKASLATLRRPLVSHLKLDLSLGLGARQVHTRAFC